MPEKSKEQDRGNWIADADRQDIISILDNAPYGIVINKELFTGEVLYINKESINLMGYSVSEIPTGKVALEKFAPGPYDAKEIEKFEKFLKELKETGKTRTVAKFLAKEGKTKYFEISVVQLKSNHLVSMWTDVSRREMAEERLKENAAKFHALFEMSPDAELIFKEDKIFDCNRAAEKMLGTKRKKRILGATFHQLSPEQQPDGQLSIEKAKDLFAAAHRDAICRFEWQLTRFDRSTIPVEVTASSIKLGGQKVLYVILRDISAWKKAEQGLLEARDELEYRVKERTAELRAVNKKLRSEIRIRENVEKELEDSREQLRFLSEHLQRAREEERTQIAREVHDELGQTLSAFKIDVAYLAKTTNNEVSSLVEQTALMEKRIDDAIHSVRHICSELRPPILEDFGLPAAIECYLEDVGKRTEIHFNTSIDSDIPKGKKGFRLMLFRIFQEAMTNILLHSDASRVDVCLKNDSGVLKLKVKDNGKGITKSQLENPRSYGIMGIRERVRFWGGQSKFVGIPQKGTTMTVTIPLDT